MQRTKVILILGTLSLFFSVIANGSAECSLRIEQRAAPILRCLPSERSGVAATNQRLSLHSRPDLGRRSARAVG
jgi:hypothetical protein